MTWNFKQPEIQTVTEVFRHRDRSFEVLRIANIDDLIDGISEEEFNLDERLPYWAELWPSAIALSRFLIDQPELVANKQVLELGCGLGLTSLALQTAGPAQLLITDYEQSALDWALENFRLNDLPVPKIKLLDWRHPDLDRTFERIVASDILYEERFFLPLIRLLRQLLNPDGLAVIAEPGRPLAGKFFNLLEENGFLREYKTESVDQDGHPILVGIHLIRKRI